MPLTVEQRKQVTDLLNGICTATRNVVPLDNEIGKPVLIGESLYLTFGVLIGVTGDMKGKLILSSSTTEVFSFIAEAMFGTKLENDMLASFSGELGNMIAGNLSTQIDQLGIKTDITYPTILQGNTKVSGFKLAFNIPIAFTHSGELDIYLLLD